MAIRKTERQGPPKSSTRAARAPLTIWDELAAIGKRVPKKDRAQIPKDGSRNFDHYLEGSPRQD